MNRSRNITIWVVTVIFALVLIFAAFVMNVIAGIILTAALIAVNILLMVLKPQKLGIWAPKPQTPPMPKPVISGPVFQTELKLVTTNVPSPIAIEISKPVMMIGRSPDCDAVIPNEVSTQVSRRHAMIRRDPDKKVYYVIAQATANGTRLNHELIAPNSEMLIKIGDILELADVCFRVDSAFY